MRSQRLQQAEAFESPLTNVALGQRAHPVILAGDLNSPPESLEMKVLQQLCPAIQDTWLAAHKGQESSSGATANTPDNTFGENAQIYLIPFLCQSAKLPSLSRQGHIPGQSKFFFKPLLSQQVFISAQQ